MLELLKLLTTKYLEVGMCIGRNIQALGMSISNLLKTDFLHIGADYLPTSLPT